MGLKGPGRGDEHLPPFNFEIKNASIHLHDRIAVKVIIILGRTFLIIQLFLGTETLGLLCTTHFR
jgi:hypothetical protein